MIRYKLVRIVGGRYLSANQGYNEPVEGICLEYEVGKITSAENVGVACYKRKEYALRPSHIDETKHSFNGGDPIALLKLKSMGNACYTEKRYRKGQVYEGGVNYQSVEVLKATHL